MEGAVRSGLNAVIALTSPQGTNSRISGLPKNAGTEVNIEPDEREVRS
jgi:hypothetical protein